MTACRQSRSVCRPLPAQSRRSHRVLRGHGTPSVPATLQQEWIPQCKSKFAERIKDVGDFLAYVAVRLLICIVQAVRIETCVALSRKLAVLVNDVIQMRGDVVDENLRLAFPDLTSDERRQLSRRMWEHLFLMVIEMAHAPRKIHDTNWQQHIHVRDIGGTMRRFFADRPHVTVSAHFGNFELAGFVFGLFGFEMFSVARPLDNRFLGPFRSRFSRGEFRADSGEERQRRRNFRDAWPARERFRCWPTRMPGRRDAGSIFSAGPLRRTKRSRCFRWPTTRRWWSDIFAAWAGRCSSSWESRPWPIRDASSRISRASPG